jgi:neural Wiskott-Aldrich syndrome protein
MPSLSGSSAPLPPPAVEKGAATAPAVVTPKRPDQLPTLTELLASAKKAKMAQAASLKGKERRISETPILPPANSGTGDAQEEGKEGGQARERQRGQEKGKERVNNDNLPFPAANPAWKPVNAKLNTNLYEAASPAKSLSSLAASDSDEDEDEDRMNIDMDLTHRDGFDPPLASTQAPGIGWIGYNSQFDVDGKVDAVSKFMEKDVSVGGDFDYDFDGWVREPSP